MGKMKSERRVTYGEGMRMMLLEEMHSPTMNNGKMMLLQLSHMIRNDP